MTQCLVDGIRTPEEPPLEQRAQEVERVAAERVLLLFCEFRDRICIRQNSIVELLLLVCLPQVIEYVQFAVEKACAIASHNRSLQTADNHRFDHPIVEPLLVCYQVWIK